MSSHSFGSHSSPTRDPGPASLRPSGATEDRHVLEEDWEIARRQGIGPLSHAGLVTEGPGSCVIGGFRVVRKLGVGGFGAVYLAEDLTRERLVAVKVLARSKAVRPDFVERFLRESRTLARLEHPNIVRGYAFGQDQGWYYCAMEYVDGESLFAWLRRLGRLRLGDALHIAGKVAEALAYLHEQNLVHRDIKPENILLSRDGQVKLADLGLAKELEEDLSLTRTGTGFGTPYYMAPEQARNAKYVDHRCDIYALGTTLYHCLAGKLPFRGETAVELILSKEQDPYLPLRRQFPDIPERVDLLVAKMMARKPAERYQSCRELLADLHRLGLAYPKLELSQPQTEAHEAAAVEHYQATQQVQVALHPSPAATPPLRPRDHWWYVRHRNRKGEVVTELLTTAQIRGLLEDFHFDLDAQVCDEPDGEFRPLISFREFQDVLRRRQTARARDKLEQRNSTLKRIYDQLQNRPEQTDSAGPEAGEQAVKSDTEAAVGAPEFLEKGLASLKQLLRKAPLDKVRQAADKQVEKVRELARQEAGRRKLIRYAAIGLAILGCLILARLVFRMLAGLLA
jgi:serine/threonine protein kinase